MRLLLTRPIDECRPLKKRLERSGWKTDCFALVGFAPPADGGKKLKKELARLASFDWLVLTSRHAAKAVRAFLRRPLPPRLKIAAVGPETLKEAKRLGRPVFAPGKSAGAEGLISFFRRKKIRGARIFYPCSQKALPRLPVALKKMGARVERVTAYRTIPLAVNRADLRRRLRRADAVVVFSPSQAKALLSARVSRKIPPLWIAFGPTTARALARGGRPADRVSEESRPEALVKLLKTIGRRGSAR